MLVKISNAELERVLVLWRYKRPMTMGELHSEFLPIKNWNWNTIQTFASRLRAKGIIELLDKYGVARFVPLISEDEYMQAEGEAIIEKFASAKVFALAMVRNGQLTDADVEELRNHFKMGGDVK